MPWTSAREEPVSNLERNTSYSEALSLLWLYAVLVADVWRKVYVPSAWALKVGPTTCSETLVVNYQPTPHNILEDRRPQYIAAESYNLAPIILP